MIIMIIIILLLLIIIFIIILLLCFLFPISWFCIVLYLFIQRVYMNNFSCIVFHRLYILFSCIVFFGICVLGIILCIVRIRITFIIFTMLESTEI